MRKEYRLIIGISIYKLEELSYVLRNVDFFEQLDMVFSIHVICNPQIFKEAFEKISLSNTNLINIEKGIPDFFTHYDEGSYRHAGNLNILCQKYSNVDQIILSDPDIIFTDRLFFSKLKKKHDNGYAVIGLEWDRTIPSKWRDFPAPHFISIDPAKVNLHLLDFRPYLEASYTRRQQTLTIKKFIAFFKRNNIWFVPGLLMFFLMLLKKNLSMDTGYFFRKLSNRRKLKVFLVENSVNYYNYNVLSNVINKIPRPLRKIPVMLKLVPDVKYYVSCLIKDYFYLYKKTRPEEMILEGEISALHFRSVRVINQQKADSLNLNLEFINRVKPFSLKTDYYIRDPKFIKVDKMVLLNKS